MVEAQPARRITWFARDSIGSNDDDDQVQVGNKVQVTSVGGDNGDCKITGNWDSAWNFSKYTARLVGSSSKTAGE